MSKRKFNVMLSCEKETFLHSITHNGSGYSAKSILHAQILLHSNNNNPSMKKDNRELPSGLGFPLSQSIASVSLMQKKGLMPPYTEKLPLKLQVILKQK